MYIQRKGRAFYLKTSVWSPEKKSSTTLTKYLGSDQEAALITLQAEVSDYDFLTLRDKLLKAAERTPTDLIKELKTKYADIEKIFKELELLQEHSLEKMHEDFKIHHAEILLTLK